MNETGQRPVEPIVGEPDSELDSAGRITTLALASLMAFAVIGYFVGLADGVPQPSGIDSEPLLKGTHHPAKADSKVVAAVTYSEISNVPMGPSVAWQAIPKSLPKSAHEVQPYDLFAEIKPSESDKEKSNFVRASRRAFNGAPPVIPHTVENTNDAACYSCHSNGMRMEGLKASVMSHGFLANCLQCHAPPPPKPFEKIDSSVRSRFVGLQAPKAGERAFPGAPPTIPHSQWMRENCHACHGGPNGWAGMESSHPWRTNCTQCHAPSATLDQAIPAQGLSMLPPIENSTRE